MKSEILLAAFIATALPCIAPAQEDFAPPPGPPPGGQHVGGRGPEMVDRWLEQLKEKNPAEYERLVKLRDEDPDAFHKELRGKLRKEQSRLFMDKYPQLKEAVMALPPDERDAIMGRLMQPQGQGPGPGGPGGPGMERGMGPGGGDMRTPEIEAQQEATRTAAAAYKSASTPEEKEKARAELKAGLGKLFDLREQQRAKDIEKFDKHLAGLKEKLAKRQANRDQIIEKRLQEITGGDELTW